MTADGTTRRPSRSAANAATLLALGLSLSACGGAEPTATVGSDAACAAPVSVSEPTAAPGESIRVRAEHLTDGCDDWEAVDVDTGQRHRPPPARPLRDQPVVWSQGNESLELARVDADPVTGAAAVTITVPADASRGAARVRVGPSEWWDLVVR